MNTTAEMLTGWTASEAIGRPAVSVLQIVGDRDAPRSDDPVEQALRTRAPASVGPVATVRSRFLASEPVAGSAIPTFDDSGRLVGVVVALRRTSGASLARIDASRIADRLRTVLDTALDGFMLLDGSGTILTFNPACV